MAKDKSGKTEITRIDLRIPNHIFEEIEKLAIETNQPTHHITGKVITTPVILNLINLGLESVRKEDFGIEAIASKDSLKEAEIEKKITNTLLQNLEAIVSDKLTDIVKNEVNEAMSKLTLISELTDSKVKEDNSEVNEIKESAGAQRAFGIESNNSEKINPPEVVNDDVSALEDTEDNSEAKEVIEVVNEDYEGLSMGKLADRFKTNKNEGKGASKTSISNKIKQLSKEDFILWSKEQDPDNKGWYINDTDKLFYPVKKKIMTTKEEFESELYYVSNSFDRIDCFMELQEKYNLTWNYEDLLEIYSNTDTPSKSAYYDQFYKLMCNSFPEYKGSDLILYRGTSKETLECYGIGTVWTEDKNLAEFFASHCVGGRYALNHTIDRTPIVLKAQFPKEYIAYKYTNDREENEVFLKIRDYSNIEVDIYPVT